MPSSAAALDLLVFAAGTSILWVAAEINSPREYVVPGPPSHGSRRRLPRMLLQRLARAALAPGAWSATPRPTAAAARCVCAYPQRSSALTLCTVTLHAAADAERGAR